MDVDGSDFPTQPVKMAARLGEAQHDDLKRPWLQQPVKIWMDAAVLEIRVPDRHERDVRVPVSLQQPIRKHHAALPRAALADAAPSA